MIEHERRRNRTEASAAALRAGLTPEQLATLETMEHFRWTLRFVRRPLFQVPIPIMFAPDGERFAVLEPDGTFNENPGFKLRP
ncbi:MAG: hypothetical protein M3374_02200 [Pseudomonadota bacterium]|nr:hypothetical protein [Pseudomonadota bacterium]